MTAGPCDTSYMEALLRRCQMAEAALQALEHQNQVMGESVPFGIFAIDSEGRLQGINRKMRDLVPLPETPTLAEINVYELQAFVEAGVCDDLRLCMQSKLAMICDYACVANKGVCHQLRFHFGPVVEPAGSVSGVMAFVENRTHIQKAQLAAQESEERYRILFQSAPVAMLERDASALKQYLEELQVSGVSDLDAYLTAHPEEVGRCMAMIRSADCNNAFLALLEAPVQ
ncbi:MAG: hypothetical protein HZB24_15270, partial [Desulfobacterales bacterium]|nr:hypothetical protein [Desulfobacterales bacterium]